ncbi:MAG: DUF1499 domain-containing protein [Pseudomonadota bacterium]
MIITIAHSCRRSTGGTLFALCAALSLGACTLPPAQPVDGGLPPCGSFPNCVSSSDTGGASIEPIAATKAQWQALKTWLSKQPDWRIDIDDDAFVQAVAITPTMRYRDDVQLQFSDEDQHIEVRSSSRLGIGDMGANRARIELLRSTVSAL